jgi:ketosteroid isomerase-like protein
MGEQGQDSENVAIIKRLYESFNERDHSTAFRYYAEDIEWDARVVATPGIRGMFRGHDGVRRFWRGWLEAWQELEWEDDKRIEELDDGRIRVVISHQRNRGRSTGIWVEQPPYEQIWTIENGLVTRMEYRWYD